MKKSASDPVRPNWQLQAAYYLALATTAAGIFSWWYRDKTEVINASMEAARQYIADSNIMRGKTVALGVYRTGAPKELNAAESESWNLYITNALYLAELVDKKRLDPSYLGTTVMCEIWLANAAGNIQYSRAGNQPTKPLVRIATDLDQTCQKLFPK